MNGSIRIRLTDTAVRRFIERFLPHVDFDLLSKEQRENVEQTLLAVFAGARYVSDNENGILFRCEDVAAQFIVKDRCIVTVLECKR